MLQGSFRAHPVLARRLGETFGLLQAAGQLGLSVLTLDEVIGRRFAMALGLIQKLRERRAFGLDLLGKGLEQRQLVAYGLLPCIELAGVLTSIA